MDEPAPRARPDGAYTVISEAAPLHVVSETHVSDSQSNEDGFAADNYSFGRDAGQLSPKSAALTGGMSALGASQALSPIAGDASAVNEAELAALFEQDDAAAEVSFLGRVRNAVFLAVLQPMLKGDNSEPFDVLLRKSATAISLPFAVFCPPFYIGYYGWVMGSGVAGHYFPTIPVVLMCLWCAVILGSYRYVVVTKTYPVWMSEGMFVVLGLYYLSAALQTPFFPVAGGMMILFIAALAVRSPMWLVHLTLGTLATAVQAYNIVFALGSAVAAEQSNYTALANNDTDAAPTTYPALTIGRIHFGPIGERFGLLGGFGVALAVSAGAFVHGIAVHHRLLHTRAVCAARLASFVAERLRRYDTAAVSAALHAYERLGPVKDDDLATSLRTLLGNLEMFRPHLPNWVLQLAQHDDEDEGSDDDGAVGESSADAASLGDADPATGDATGPALGSGSGGGADGASSKASGDVLDGSGRLDAAGRKLSGEFGDPITADSSAPAATTRSPPVVKSPVALRSPGAECTPSATTPGAESTGAPGAVSSGPKLTEAALARAASLHSVKSAGGSRCSSPVRSILPDDRRSQSSARFASRRQASRPQSAKYGGARSLGGRSAGADSTGSAPVAAAEPPRVMAMCSGTFGGPAGGAAAGAMGTSSHSMTSPAGSGVPSTPLSQPRRPGRPTSVALVHFVFPDAADEAETEGEAVRARQRRYAHFVDRLHAIAATTHGEVHSFVANVAVVSFGATTMAKGLGPARRVHPIDACKFILRLRRDCERRHIAGICGAVCTGPAHCRVAGNKSHAALVIDAAYEARLWKVLVRARSLGVILADNSTRHAADATVVARAVGAVPLLEYERPTTSAAGTLVHELVREGADEAALEWSTLMQTAALPGATAAFADTPGGGAAVDENDDAVTDAAACCLRGEFAAALQHFERVSARLLGMPAVAALRRAAAACLARNASPSDFVRVALSEW